MANLSAEVKMILRSEKALANYLDRGVGALNRNVKSSLHNAYNGMKWVSWSAACLNDNYQDECRQWISENYRLYECTKEFVQRSDAILDMIVMLVNYMLDEYDEATKNLFLDKLMKSQDYCLYEQKDNFHLWQGFYSEPISIEENNFFNRISRACNLTASDLERYSVVATSGIIAEYRTAVVIKMSIAYFVAKSMAASLSLSNSVRNKLGSITSYAFSLLSLSGFAYQAAISARRLKLRNKKYFQILYENKLEMFFFLFEGAIPPDFYYSSLWTTDEDRFLYILQELTK